MNFTILEKDNSHLKEQVRKLSEEVEILKYELNTKNDIKNISFGMFEDQVNYYANEKLSEIRNNITMRASMNSSNPKTYSKTAFNILNLIANTHQRNGFQKAFNHWRFSICGKPKIQEDLEIQVRYK